MNKHFISTLNTTEVILNARLNIYSQCGEDLF